MRWSRKMTRCQPALFSLTALLPAAPFSHPPSLPVPPLCSSQRSSPVRLLMASLPPPPWPSAWSRFWSWATSGRRSLGSSASPRLGSHLTVNRELSSFTGWVSSCASVTAAVMTAWNCSGGLIKTPAWWNAASVWSLWRTLTGCRRGGWCSSATKPKKGQSRYEGLLYMLEKKAYDDSALLKYAVYWDLYTRCCRNNYKNQGYRFVCCCHTCFVMVVIICSFMTDSQSCSSTQTVKKQKKMRNVAIDLNPILSLNFAEHVRCWRNYRFCCSLHLLKFFFLFLSISSLYNGIDSKKTHRTCRVRRNGE